MTAARLAAAQRLAELAAALCEDRAPPADVASEFCRAVGAYLGGAAPTLDDALGLTPQPGEAHWRTQEARQRRDEVLRRAAAEFGLSGAQLAAELSSYRCRAWQRDCDLPDYPPRYHGTLWANLWTALRACDRPLSVRSVQMIVRPTESEKRSGCLLRP